MICLPEIDVKAYRYVLPVEAEVTVIDESFRLMGDINRDGVIDDADFAIMEDAYGSVEGDPHWNPDCDLDGDGRVEANDMKILSNNMGKASVYTTPFTVEVSAGVCTLIGTYNEQELTAKITVPGTSVRFIFTLLGIFGRAIIL